MAQHPYLAKLEAWEAAAAEARKWQKEEMRLRQELFGGAFPNPKEGVNKYELPDGRIVKGTYNITRKVDEAALPAVEQLMRKRFRIDPESGLIKRKPELAVGVYKKLTDEQRAVFDEAVISKPGAPTLTIV